jgi:4-hydroxy-tetrahydrodipicolinate synthase
MLLQFPMRKGSTVAVVTPFDPKTGNIDFEGVKRLLQYHLDAGTKNLCILGTTGEASLMSMQERKTVLETAVNMVKGKMCILAGCGTINPNSVREMTQQAIDVGCDASLVVTPYYVKPPQRGLVKHMTFAADLGLPVIMYNVPGRTGVNFADEFMAIAAEHPNIVGLKDATGDLSRLHKMRELVKDPSFLIYSGDDSTSLDFILQGGDGCISVTANVAAPEMAQMVDLALAGKADEARAINDKLDGLHTNLFLEANPIPAKWGVYRIGLIDSPYCRPPLDAFDDQKFGAKLEEALQQAGLL